MNNSCSEITTPILRHWISYHLNDIELIGNINIYGLSVLLQTATSKQLLEMFRVFFTDGFRKRRSLIRLWEVELLEKFVR